MVSFVYQIELLCNTSKIQCNQIGFANALATTDLALGNRPDPGEGQVQANDHYTHDPEHAMVLRAVVAEDDGEDDAAKVACSTDESGHNTW